MHATRAEYRMLDDITDFKIVPQYKIRGTTYWVIVSGGERPVIRIRRDVSVRGSLGKLHRVFLDSNPDRWIGLVTDKAAYDFDKRKIGEIGNLGSSRGDLSDPFILAQDGREPLVGQPTGFMGSFLRLPGIGLLCTMLPANPFFWIMAVVIGLSRIKFRFTGDGSRGFEMVKGALSNKFRVSIHDPELDRLLIFAAAISIQDDYGYSSPKKVLTELVSAFDPAAWKRSK